MECAYYKRITFKCTGTGVRDLRLKVVSDVDIAEINLNNQLIFSMTFFQQWQKQVEKNVMNILKTDGSENFIILRGVGASGTPKLTVSIVGDWDSLEVSEVEEQPKVKTPIIGEILSGLTSIIGEFIDKMTNFLKEALNYVVQMAIPIWNTIAQYVNQLFLKPLTDMINFLIQRFIERFDMVVAVNFTIPVVWNLFEKAVQTGEIKYIGFAFVAPVVGMVLGKFLRVMLKPKPFTVETLGFRFEVPQLPQVTAKAPAETEYALEDFLDFEYSFGTVALGSFWITEELEYHFDIMSPTLHSLEEYLDFEYGLQTIVSGMFWLGEELDYDYAVSPEDTGLLEEELSFSYTVYSAEETLTVAEEELDYDYSVYVPGQIVIVTERVPYITPPEYSNIEVVTEQ